MDEGKPETDADLGEEGPSAVPAPPGADERQPLVSREAARAELEEARRLYRVAEFVQARRASVGIDSAVTAQRALTLALRVLLRVHGSTPPRKFSELVREVREVAEKEKLLTADHVADLGVISDARRRLFEDDEITGAEDRSYDRAFLRSAEWFGAVESLVNEKLPRRKSSRMTVALAAGTLVVFALGVIAGRQVRSRPGPAVAGSAGPGPSAGVLGPAFTATFYRDTVFSEPTMTRRDGSIAFDWGSKAPTESLPSDNFAVRWEGNLFISNPGKYAFYLTSDDGSRFALDGNLVIDNWGSHAEHTEDTTIELSEGAHRVRVEFFDKVGPAVVRFEWSSERFSRRLVTSADLI